MAGNSAISGPSGNQGMKGADLASGALTALNATSSWMNSAKNTKMSLEEIFNNFYYKILYSYPFIGDYYITTML